MFCLFDGRSKRLHSIPQQTRQEGIEKFVVTCLLFWCKYFVWNTLNWKTTSLTNLQLEKLLPPQAHTCFGQKGNQTHNRPSVVHFGFIICSTWSVIADIPIVGCRVNDTKCRHISPFGHWRVIEHFCKHSLRFFDFFSHTGWSVHLGGSTAFCCFPFSSSKRFLYFLDLLSPPAEWPDLFLRPEGRHRAMVQDLFLTSRCHWSYVRLVFCCV